MPAGVPEPRNQNILSAEHTQSALQIVLLSAAFPGQVGAAGHLMDGAVRLLNGRALQLAAQAGLSAAAGADGSRSVPCPGAAVMQL